MVAIIVCEEPFLLMVCTFKQSVKTKLHFARKRKRDAFVMEAPIRKNEEKWG